MGGGGETKTTTQIITPQPPPQPSTAEAIQEYVNSLPQIFQAQLDFAPQEAAQQVNLAQQYALPLAQIAKDVQSTLYPETQALQESLAQQAQQGFTEGVSPEQLAQFQDAYRANLGTNAGSPIGAESTARALLGYQEDYKRYYRDLALSLAGRQPLVQPSQPQTTNQLQQFSPADVLNYKSGLYNAFSQASRPIVTQNSYSSTNPNYSGYAQAIFGR